MFAALFVDDRDVLVQPELREVVRGAPLSPDAFTGWDEGTVHARSARSRVGRKSPPIDDKIMKFERSEKKYERLMCSL